MDTKKTNKDIQLLRGSLNLQTKLIEQSSMGKMVDLILRGHMDTGVWTEHQTQTIFLMIQINLSYTKKSITFTCNTVVATALHCWTLIKINAKYEFLFKFMYNVSLDLRLLNQRM